MGSFAEASRAFENAASDSQYPHLRAQLLVDAARAANLAGDEQRAIAIYDRILAQEVESPAANEARLRRAEIARS
jgi:Tfp pilus assembly protein PilF